MAASRVALAAGLVLAVAYPLLLAVGQALGAEAWVVPALTAAVVLCLYVVGAALFDPMIATHKADWS